MYRIVYMTINKLTNRKYIGKHTCTDLNDSYFGSNYNLIEDIQTLGKHNFIRIILDYAETDEELAAKESYYLKLNKVVESDEFYNQSYAATGGGNPFEHWSQERYEKYIDLQRKVQTGKKRSQKTRDRISKNNVGFRGKHHTNEAKEKIRQAAKKHNASIEMRQKLREANLGGNNASSKAVLVLDKNLEVMKRFEAKYMVEFWFHEEGFTTSKGMARKILAPYFKSKELWNNKYYFILESEYDLFVLDKISS